MESFYIIDDQNDSTECRASVYASTIANLPTEKSYTDEDGVEIVEPIDNSKYIDGSHQWSEEKTRITDGKYIVRVCKHYDNPHNYPIEEKQSDWFPEE